ncbi:galactosyltransferase-related protein [Methylobacterium sp. Leaf466]|uniref:glycosyltransferase family 2 protein n=1 Tax=Methylobacterium sp. Leaf466 TaxID=1736386 RepID=UPI000A70C90D|nr:galactosyltransferase-related protein [Methylobacterium sp. Leaf466]
MSPEAGGQASVLTLVRGRDAHLRNLMRGLARQTMAPCELVIAWMQPEPAPDLPDPGCRVRHLFVPGEPMPLAAARNRAAEAARGERLIFLDVDCIPGPGLVAAYAGAATDGLLLGEVLYLPEGAVGPDLDDARLDRLGRVHPAKPAIPATGLRPEPDAKELWGLSFALPAAAYADLGGMDEGFSGYGAEETDFAVRLAAAGLPTHWVAGARAYHQHHPVHVPPLHQFDHILRNAARFHARHGTWCMDYWLGQFRDAGLIAWEPDAPEIQRLRAPEPAEIAAAGQPGTRLFS